MVTVAAASWGTWSLFLRPTGLPATVTGPVVFLVMGLCALPLARREPRPRWRRDAVVLLIANAALDALNVLTFFGAMTYTSVAIAVVTHYLAPILIALAAPRIDGTRTRGAVPAALVALAGLVIVLQPWRTPAAGAVVGAALGTASAVCYAANVFVVRRLAARVGAARAIAYHGVLGAALIAPFGLGGLAAVTWPDLARLSLGAATLGALAGVLFVIGLQRIGAARAAVLTFAEPIVAVLVGFVAWGEAPAPIAALGGALVLGAGIYVARTADGGGPGPRAAQGGTLSG
jgi:drug/metabolite transporter (DMT)-like permease